MKKKNKVFWIELLRVFSCFAVVLLHVGSKNFRTQPVDTFTWQVSNFYHGITRFGVICFVMISGYLYLSSEKEIDIREFYRKKIGSLLRIYLIWAVFYGVYATLCSSNPTVGIVGRIKSVVYCIVYSHYHLWYLPMLIALLLLTPMLKAIVQAKDGKLLTQCMVGVFFIFKVFRYTMELFSFPGANYIFKIMDTFMPDLYINYIGYYLIGYCLGNYEIKKRARNSVYVLGVVGILAGIWLSGQYSIKNKTPIQDYYANFSAAACMFSMAVFLFFKYELSKIKCSERTKKMIYFIAGNTFGIYLIHAFWVDLLQQQWGRLFLICPVVGTPVIAGIVFSISLLLIWGIRKIPILKRWVL